MARKRAVILEIDGRVARVLAAGGEFRTIRAPKGVSVGDEISLDAVAPTYNWRPQLALVATLLLMLVFSSAGLNTLADSFNQVAAYVTVDINPSVELSVNRWGWVIDARGLNSDGVNLLGGTEYTAYKLADIVPRLASLAADRGYIGEGKPNTVIVAAVPAGEQTLSDTVKNQVSLAQKQTTTAVANKPGSPVTVSAIVTPDPSLRGDAEAMKLSVGKLAVVLEARQSGVPVRVSDVERDGLAKAIEAAGGQLHELVIKAQDEPNYHGLAAQYGDKLKQEKDDDDKGKGNNGKGHKDGDAQPNGKGSEPDQGAGQIGAPPDGTNTGNGGATSGSGTGQTDPQSGQPGQTGQPAQGGPSGQQPGAGGQPGQAGNGQGSGQGSDNGQGPADSGKGKGNDAGSDTGKGSDNGKDNGKANDKGNDKGDIDKLADRLRDGFRELGERIKHGIGKDK